MVQCINIHPEDTEVQSIVVGSLQKGGKEGNPRCKEGGRAGKGCEGMGGSFV
jgi:hypothetical protein